mmetsp:Transcript_6786/g.11044  ORF Transcript_6786/g.11044 Transcript_6786/m.11044 type:complete len:200 (-) Transcript_6786:8-607(-)
MATSCSIVHLDQQPFVILTYDAVCLYLPHLPLSLGAFPGDGLGPARPRNRRALSALAHRSSGVMKWVDPAFPHRPPLASLPPPWSKITGSSHGVGGAKSARKPGWHRLWTCSKRLTPLLWIESSESSGTFSAIKYSSSRSPGWSPGWSFIIFCFLKPKTRKNSIADQCLPIFFEMKPFDSLSLRYFLFVGSLMMFEIIL